jgi:hypothetical protein
MSMTDSVPLAPLTPAVPSPATPQRRPWPDVVLAGLVLAFAFLAASFAARNSDLWLHLATGRAIAQRTNTFGVDPFSYTTAGVYWANHAWLFDLSLYATYSLVGGAGLVAVKAGLLALLAWLMLRIARNGGPFWASGGCVLLAVLAMSPRLLLQPTVLSLLLLAGCLALLREGGQKMWALPAIIVLWVNLDSWFWLGPLAVALYGVGERLSPPDCRDKPGGSPGWLLPACLLACLASPHHVHALTLPAELSPAVWRSGLRNDVRFAPLFDSPWRLAPLGSTGGYSLAAWAYFVLLALGMGSFALNRAALRGWRSLVWISFAALGAWQARLVPFFAVVAGPITALNFQEILGRSGEPSRSGSECRSARGTYLGRASLAAAAVALLALAWPGWLQGFNRHDRAVAWRVRIDPSLQRMADSLKQWRQSRTLPAGARTFGLHPDVAHYLAWFCPGEQSFLDSRLPLFLGVVNDYEQLCLALAPTLAGNAPARSRWEQILRDYQIAVLVHYDRDLRRLAPALRQIVQEPQRWELLRVDGQAVVVGWKGADNRPSGALAFDANRAAFVRQEEAVPAPPADSMPRLPEARSWWQRYLWGTPESTWEADAAAVYLQLFEERAPMQFRQQRRRVLARHAAALAGLPALSAGGVPPSVAVTMRLVFDDVFLSDLVERPPALPIVAVRAARRAIAIQPEQANAWLWLAQAYLALGRTTTESSPNARLSVLAEIRYIQTVTALVQAVTLDPNLAAAHETLALLFAERGYLDLALRHRSALLRLTRRAGRLPGEEKDAHAARIERLEGAIEEMRREVEDAENRYAVGAVSLTGEPLKRAYLALQNGLAGKAIDDVLLRSHADLYGVEGIRLLLELLLLTGRAREARELLDRKEMRANPAGLGVYVLPAGHRWAYRFSAFDWFDLCQHAAAGATGSAVAALDRLRQPMRVVFEKNHAQMKRRFCGLCAGEIGLGAVPGALLPRLMAHLIRQQAGMQLEQTELLLVVQGDLDVVEGMLLLESGLPTHAAERFRRALPLYRRAEQTARGLPGRELAQRYLERLDNAPR